MRRITTALGLALALATAGLAHADERAKDVEAFMAEYLKAWNAADAGTITEKYYRFENPHPWKDKAGLQAEFDRLKGQGYSHSADIRIESCLLGRDQAVTELRFTRLKTDGQPMPPKDRTSLYFARKFPDGWRITSFMAISPSADLNCKSATD